MMIVVVFYNGMVRIWTILVNLMRVVGLFMPMQRCIPAAFLAAAAVAAAAEHAAAQAATQASTHAPTMLMTLYQHPHPHPILCPRRFGQAVARLPLSGTKGAADYHST